MLLGVLHLVGENTLQCGQLTARLLQFHKPALAVGHTCDAIRDADLRDTAELVRKAAQRLNALAEIPLYFFFCHAAELPQKILQ